MDAVRTRINEHGKYRRRKLLIGAIVVIILVIIAFMLENNINAKPTDITIMKSDISEEKAVFIPVDELDTNIIVVKDSSGSYKLAFDDCTGCYLNDNGAHGQFKNTPDNTGLVCKRCKHDLTYDEMGFLIESCMPVPIAEIEITSQEDRFIITADYLERMQQELELLRSGQAANSYTTNTSR